MQVQVCSTHENTTVDGATAHLAGSLLQVVPGVCVLQLNGLDSAQVVQVAAVLGVTATLLRPLCFRPELLCLYHTKPQLRGCACWVKEEKKNVTCFSQPTILIACATQWQ